MAIRALVVFPGILLSCDGTAGIETSLLDEAQGECRVRITHDATPSSQTATLVIRIFKRIDGLVYPCGINQQRVEDSLTRAIAKYRSSGDLKPEAKSYRVNAEANQHDNIEHPC